MDNRPIGVFDSGLGGLTAAAELAELLPGEQIVYFGDSYNMPYGEKSREEIIRMSRADLAFLLSKNVKAVLVACGTATSNALDTLEQECPVPIYGVVEPAVREAVSASRNERVGVLATRATIRAGNFERLLHAVAPRISVTSQACPKFATMVEDGIFEKTDPRVTQAVEEYLPPLRAAGVDTIILGCTHYPLLADIISEYMGPEVRLISSGAAAARRLCADLRDADTLSDGARGGTCYFTTGERDAFARTAQLMLRKDISSTLTGIEPFDKR
ncbi:MAG: glutamate racemase [Oscillospiraceae bacterium]|jgi:glutamate racemase